MLFAFIFYDPEQRWLDLIEIDGLLAC